MLQAGGCHSSSKKTPLAMLLCHKRCTSPSCVFPSFLQEPNALFSVISRRFSEGKISYKVSEEAPDPMHESNDTLSPLALLSSLASGTSAS